MSTKSAQQAWPLSKILARIGLWFIFASTIGVEARVATIPHQTRYRSAPVNRTIAGRDSIWQPTPGLSWQIVLENPVKVVDGRISPDVDVWFIDLYDNSADTIKTLKSQGKKVVCYFSGGSWENWRADKNQFRKSDLGSVMDGWPSERWINIRSANVRQIMKKRIAYAYQKGCDAIDPDNINGYENNNGLGLTQNDAINYVKFLAKTAASYNLAMSLKNGVNIVTKVLPYVQFAVTESCLQYDECDAFRPFIDANKAVFHIEYPRGSANTFSTASVKEICPTAPASAGIDGFSTVLKKMLLDGWVQYCGQQGTFSTTVA